MSESRIWFITGCSTGIGRAVAEGLIAAGQRVVVTARNVAQVEDLASDRVLALPIDITSEDSIAAAVAATTARFGHIDVLVNNAAIGLIAAIEESTAEEVEQMFRTNVLGTLAVLRHVLPGMRARRSGYVMTVGSIGSFRSQPALGIYGGVKHALAGIHEALTDELKPLGIRATLLALGSYRTGFRHRGMKHGAVIIDDYDSTAGAVRRRLKGETPAVMGDPASVTPVLLALADMDDPPRRLAVGADALAGMRARLGVMEKELDAWEALSQSAGVRPEDVAALQGSTGPAPR